MIVRADGAAVFQLRYVRGATWIPCAVSTRQIDSTLNSVHASRRRTGLSAAARVEFLAKKIDADFFNFVGFLKFSVLTLEIFDALLFRRSST
ncbi:hypothetical protein EEB13_31125 [Rhodococcus sp. WS3]|nr:hypothetical protein EEB13_31125 [Rhodococcus sp. WS3]